MEVKPDKLLCAQKNESSTSSKVNCPCNCGGVLKGDGRSNKRTSLQCSTCNCYYVADDLTLNVRLMTKYTRGASDLPLNTAQSKALARVGIKVIPYSPMWHLLRKAIEIETKPELKDSKYLESLVRELAVLVKEAEAIVKSFLPRPDKEL